MRIILIEIASLVWYCLVRVWIRFGPTLSRHKILENTFVIFLSCGLRWDFKGGNRAEAHLSGSRSLYLLFAAVSGIPVGISFLSGSRSPFRVNEPFCYSPARRAHSHVQERVHVGPDRQLWVCGLLGATCLKGWRNIPTSTVLFTSTE